MSRYQGTKDRTAANPGESPGLPEAAQAKRVLVVDDEPGIRTLLAQLLSRAGYVVDMAQDGSDAWAMLQKRPYAALILDLKMPGNGGEALYQQLKRVNEILARRVIFITGDIVNHAEREFVAATGNPIIEKPFDLNTLQQQLQSLLND
ncbi:MAG: response regulator [Chloroflexota bacterium]